MPMTSEEWAKVKAQIASMERVMEALRHLREKAAVVPGSESAIHALDKAIAENETLVNKLKGAMAN
jgi:hypothetical protein